jgi:Arc/MetJ-type ribon-helix-helix transcriptional regulator
MPYDQTAIRFPTELIVRLDALVKRQVAETPGVTFSRSSVVRMLLTEALDRRDKETD